VFFAGLAAPKKSTSYSIFEDEDEGEDDSLEGTQDAVRSKKNGSLGGIGDDMLSGEELQATQNNQVAVQEVTI